MNLDIYTSTVSDGAMKLSGQNYDDLLPTRTAFLEKHALSPQDTTYVNLAYDTDDFRRYFTLEDGAKGDGMTRRSSIIADALVVTKPGHALFLPLADCIGAVIHDPARSVLMLSHLGRHNLEQTGGAKSIEYLVHTYGCNPSDLTVWLSPAAGKESYPLYAFDNHSLHDVAYEQLTSAGVLPGHIEVSPIDSATDENYYSHSKFLKGERATDGRFAVVAVLR